ncbi:uncharacterized protein K444DRAFT_403487 [Hyaloscypha bicolor E]|uniref:Uncharacterized protein n=1 Tax=Hyaloscypha bicolor E TaxID=1095630 RepID=A0A2J6TAF0_9HELO|nr:uncharacterized protein K444DRAFT_403487 [Hyaloscypha bicolor E]PMD59989.1 hypothetical protein K444DRAFT_403487 [Hyaloscypha bicolor E]
MYTPIDFYTLFGVSTLLGFYTPFGFYTLIGFAHLLVYTLLGFFLERNGTENGSYLSGSVNWEVETPLMQQHERSGVSKCSHT